MSNLTFQVIGLAIQRSVFDVYNVIHVKFNRFSNIRSALPCVIDFCLPVTNFP